MFPAIANAPGGEENSWYGRPIYSETKTYSLDQSDSENMFPGALILTLECVIEGLVH